jgi:hypothetical protein
MQKLINIYDGMWNSIIKLYRSNPHRFFLLFIQLGHTSIMVHLLIKAYDRNVMEFVVLLGYFVIHLIIYAFLVMAIEDIRKLYSLVLELARLLKDKESEK